jgi:hypothetical protein
VEAITGRLIVPNGTVIPTSNRQRTPDLCSGGPPRRSPGPDPVRDQGLAPHSANRLEHDIAHLKNWKALGTGHPLTADRCETPPCLAAVTARLDGASYKYALARLPTVSV